MNFTLLWASLCLLFMARTMRVARAFDVVLAEVSAVSSEEIQQCHRPRVWPARFAALQSASWHLMIFRFWERPERRLRQLINEAVTNRILHPEPEDADFNL